MPEICAKPCRGSVCGGLASYRVRPMQYADQKNEAALMMKAMSRPKTAVASPPTDAPMASMADQVALDTAFAGSSSSAVVTFGIVAVRAGSKNPDAAIVHAITT